MKRVIQSPQGTPELSQRQLARTLLEVAASVIVPLIAMTIKDSKNQQIFNTFDQLMIGFAVYTVLTLTRLAWTNGQLLEIERDLERSKNLRRAIDKRLEELRDSYFTVLEKADYDKNFPAQYFTRVLDSLGDRLYSAATKEEVRVDELSFACTELVCNVIANRNDQILRLVYSLNNEQFAFDTWSRGYYKSLVGLAAGKKVREVRRLFIYDDDPQLSKAEFIRLFHFHLRAPRFSCRLISRADWLKLEKDLRIPDGGDDFGVWGDLLVYRAVAARPDHIEGVYSAQHRTVQQYTEFFDIGWRHGREPDPCDAATPMTLHELFEGTPPPAHLAAGEAAVWHPSQRLRRTPSVRATLNVPPPAELPSSTPAIPSKKPRRTTTIAPPPEEEHSTNG